MPPPGMSEFIGHKPESSRLVQLKAHQEALARRTEPPRPPVAPVERRANAFSEYRRGSNPGRVMGPSGSAPYFDPEREAEAVERIMRSKR